MARGASISPRGGRLRRRGDSRPAGYAPIDPDPRPHRGRPEGRLHALNAGFDAYLEKPVDAAELAETVQRLYAGPRCPRELTYIVFLIAL
jgi:hypothetical protein